MRQIQAIDYLVIAAFFAVMIGVGVYFSRRSKSTDQFFGGDKSVSRFSRFAGFAGLCVGIGAGVAVFVAGHWFPCLRGMIVLNAITTAATLLGMAWGTWEHPDTPDERADGFHLPPEMLHGYVRMCPLDRLVVVSDCSYPGGLPPGRHVRNGSVSVLEPSGFLRSPATNSLHGSSCLLADCVKVLNSPQVGLSMSDCIRLCRDNPLKLIRTGRIESFG